MTFSMQSKTRNASYKKAENKNQMIINKPQIVLLRVARWIDGGFADSRYCFNSFSYSRNQLFIVPLLFSDFFNEMSKPPPDLQSDLTALETSRLEERWEDIPAIADKLLNPINKSQASTLGS